MTNYSNIPAHIVFLRLVLMMTFGVTAAFAQTCTVDWNNVHQRIDGFGASSAFTGFTWTTNQADMFFTTNNGTARAKNGTNFTFTGIGLSLLRNQIQPAASTNGIAFANANEIALMQYAQARGARVWSAPWSPPVFCKNTNTLNGGSYNGTGGNSTNQLYARELAGYVVNMKNTYGVNIYALSIQNEPDVSTSYASCLWNDQQFHDFVTNLYPAMVASNVASTLIMLPEDEHWAATYYTTAMSDPNVAADVGIVADHNYDGPNFQTGSTTPPAALDSYGKALWETEVSTGDSPDGSISNAVYWAQRIHLFFTVAQANAWHYWWLINLNSDNEGLADNNYVPTRRMYAMGQFSRFVRPNFYRIDANTTGTALISAFNDAGSGRFAIIAINTNASTSIIQTFNLANFPSVSSVTPWITSAAMSLSNQTTVAVSGGSFSYTLPALSVVTFVGQAASAPVPPTLATVTNQIINAQQTLQITNVATDANVPPNTLTFNLLVGPVGATLTPLNGTNAVFAWTPPISDANTTNPVAVVVTDNQTLLSATNNFNVVVNPLPAPVLMPVADQTVDAGVTLLVTNLVTDAYVPPLTLSFSLLSGPGGVGGATGIYSWRPLVNQAGTTNVVTVMVADSEVPSRNATNSFKVIVNPLSSLPTLSSINIGGGQVGLTVTGPQGPDYTVLTTTNLTEPLANWQVLMTTNSPAVPVLLHVPFVADPMRFYSIQIGP